MLFEYLRRMGFNAIALLDWAYAEQKRQQNPGMPADQEQIRIIHEIIQTGPEFRFYAAVAVSKLFRPASSGRIKNCTDSAPIQAAPCCRD
jgi:hypothetical protein